jgi:hypothetical protein
MQQLASRAYRPLARALSHAACSYQGPLREEFQWESQLCGQQVFPLASHLQILSRMCLCHKLCHSPTGTHAVSCEMRPMVLHLVTTVSPAADLTLISGEAP